MGGLRAGESLLKHLDQGWVEFLGGQGVIKFYGSRGGLLDHSLGLGVRIYFFIFFMVTLILLLLVYLDSLCKNKALKRLR